MMRDYKRVSVLAMSIIALTASLTACLGVRKTVKKSDELATKATEKAGSQAVSMKNCKANIGDDTIKAVNEFTFDLYQNMRSEDNMFISPFSIYTALSILDNATVNDGKKELEGLLRIKDISKTNEQLNTIVYNLSKSESGFMSNNSILTHKDYTFADAYEKSFVTPANEYYDAKVVKVDFTDENTYKRINKWVKDATNGMISPYIKDTKAYARQGADTLLKIFNAVYFQSKWKYEFNKDKTSKQTFYGLKGKKSIDMMNLSNQELKYLKMDGLIAVSIPYTGSTAMEVIMSENDKTTVGEVVKKLSSAKLNKYIDKLEKVDSKMFESINLPKFDFESNDYDLVKITRKLGVNAIFDGNGSLAKISDDAKVGKICHKAMISVDEAGTKAAAVTEVSVDRNAVMLAGDKFIINRPYIYIIRDTVTGVVLFIGQMNNLPAN